MPYACRAYTTNMTFIHLSVYKIGLWSCYATQSGNRQWQVRLMSWLLTCRSWPGS